MSPNQPKTPISSFRLNKETKDALAAIGDRWQTTMTGVVERMTAAAREAAENMAEMNEAADREAGRYPFEAYHAAVMAFRTHMGYEVGDRLPSDVSSAIDYAVRAANPIIREAQHYETLQGVVRELEAELDADPAIVEPFRGQLPPEMNGTSYRNNWTD